MQRDLRDALSTGVVIGTVVGFADGLASVSCNSYVPGFALVFFATPIVLTTLFLCLTAVVLSVLARLPSRPVEVAPSCAAGWLVALVALLWVALWWGDVTVRARQAGGGGWLFGMALPPLLVLGGSAGVLVRALLLRIEPACLRRWLGRAAVVAGAVNLLLLVPLTRTVLSEQRRLLYDGEGGPPRREGELNVLLITIDTLRADRLAAFGGRADVTPHLNRLATDGVAFTNAISQSSWTLPSIASMFTGLTPGSHGAGKSANAFDLLARTPLPAEVWTFTQTLHAHGYLTQAFVTNPYLSMHYGFGSGFDRYENVTMHSETFIALGDTFVFRLLTALWPRLIIGDVGESITGRALPWLERHRNEKFFLWLHYVDVHAPYGDPRVLGNKSFRGDALNTGEPRSLIRSAAALDHRFVPIARLRAGEIHLDAEQRRQLIDLYDAGVRYDDEQIGRIVEGLDQTGLGEHTIVIVASDHGEEFWEHGGVEHGHTLYDELVRVPLIIRVPGGPSGKRISESVRLMDIAPTVVDLAGCDDHDVATEGRSLRSLLDGEPDSPRVGLSETLLFADEKRSLRTDRFKFIVWSTGKEELYDIAVDPGEQRDLAAREDLAASQRAILRDTVLAQRSPELIPASDVDGGTRERLRALGYGG